MNIAGIDELGKYFFLIIVALVVIIITYFQFKSFLNNKKEIERLKNIFPKKANNYYLEYLNETDIIAGINSKIKGPILNTIINSINNYISNNKGAVSDFHLIKDIVDRNCDSKEDEVHSQLPVPIYLGLTGTMLGILIGVGSLVVTGALNNIVNASGGIDGINDLLGGVALAMISSVFGIIFNIRGARLTKEANTEVEKNKNTFLSWMQAELLPNLSSDASGALVRMTKNLSTFNETFSSNTKNLESTFSKVNQSYKSHVSLIEEINRLNIPEITTANISVYENLKNSTNEIGVFAEYLLKTNEYLTIIQNLSQNLGDYEKRTRILEDAGAFFKRNEDWLADNINSSNLKVKDALNRFDTETQQYLLTLQDSLNQQILRFNRIIIGQQENLEKSLEASNEIITLSLSKNQKLFENAIKLQQEAFEKAINYQQKTFESKLEETTILIDEIKALSHIKESITEFKKELKIKMIK